MPLVITYAGKLAPEVLLTKIVGRPFAGRFPASIRRPSTSLVGLDDVELTNELVWPLVLTDVAVGAANRQVHAVALYCFSHSLVFTFFSDLFGPRKNEIPSS